MEPRDRFIPALLIVAVVGLVGRIAYVYATRSDPLVGDGYTYSNAPRLILGGQGFINPLAYAMGGVVAQDATHPPAWTMLLTGITALGGRSDLAHQVTAAVVGAGTVVMTGLAGRASADRRVGLVAAAIVCVYPNIWLYEREVLAEPLAMLGVATAIWQTYRFRAHPSLGGALALGALTALLASTRSELILIGPLLALPVILGRNAIEWSRRLLWLGAAGAAAVVLLLPWFVYNTTRFEAPVYLSTGLGTAMASGTCDQTYSGDRLGYYEFGCIALLPKSDDPSVADGQTRRVALGYVQAHLGETPKVMAARVGRTFNLFRPFQQAGFEGERGSQPWVLHAALFAYWLLLPFAIAGAFVARRRSIPLYPLLAFPAIVAASVLLTIGAVRYRAPAEISLALLAAIAIDACIRRLGIGRRSITAGDEAPTSDGTGRSPTPSAVGAI